ncbi:lysophospholipase [Anaerovorax odorimutans]|uniref:Lysophospholipase n=1 Tax=Anaerovorax odorimutans TaxID=109327 RepID=A0ABT1RN29_9FIRM|nr:alpha/beta fold hydrolase [Anaerovorax odorimutans]MCQ4636584.1 lysophospholipase [Anaerovorax odorimutans]
MKRKKALKITGIVIICAVVLAVSVCGATGIYVYNASVHAVNQERRPLACKKESLAKYGFDVDKFEAQYQVEQVEIPSTFGDHKIPANYLTADGRKDRKTVVMAHGLNGNRLTGYPVAAILMRYGYNILTYDQRDSGESEAQYMTCGYWESRDFKDCVDYVRKRTGDDIQVGGWGSSIGGATIGFYLGTEAAQKDLDFAVLDCPVSDMREIIGFLVRNTKWIPMDFKLDMGDLATRLRLGYSYGDGDVRKYVADTRVPVLIFNSRADGVTPYHMGVDLYRVMKHNEKQICSVDDSRHTDIYIDYPQLYEETMMSFIEKYGGHR